LHGRMLKPTYRSSQQPRVDRRQAALRRLAPDSTDIRSRRIKEPTWRGARRSGGRPLTVIRRSDGQRILGQLLSGGP
jgi:hypothetical protein